MAASIRKRLFQHMSDADFDAFCLDKFPNVRQRFAAGMDRQQRITLLIEHSSKGEVNRRLTDWLKSEGSTSNDIRRAEPRSLLWVLSLSVGGALFTVIVLVAVLLSRPAQPQIIVVSAVENVKTLSRYGVTIERLDSPEQFEEKVRRAGPDKIRYQVSEDRDAEKQELRRLVIALQNQNDRLVAAMQYLTEQVIRLQSRSNPKAGVLRALLPRLESRLEIERPDLFSGSTLDLGVGESVKLSSPRHMPVDLGPASDLAPSSAPRPTRKLPSKSGSQIAPPMQPATGQPRSVKDVDAIQNPTEQRARVPRKRDDLDSLLDSASNQASTDSNTNRKDLPEQLSIDLIKGVFRSLDLDKCADASPSETVQVQLTIERNGTISNARAMKQTARAECVVKVIKQVRLSGFTGNPMSLTFPFFVH